MKQAYLVIIVFSLLSCKQGTYRAGSGSMEETIKVGQTFPVTLTDKFERNDIVVFDHYCYDYNSGDFETGEYESHWEKRVFRLVAYSGDAVEIKDGEIFVNGGRVALPPKAKVRYEVFSKEQIAEFDEENSYEARMIKPGDTIVYSASLTTEQAFDYGQRKPFIIRVKRTLPEISYINDTSYARISEAGVWTSDNYGPFTIPSPGETVVADSINFKFYHNIPGIKKGKNVINEKLYFVLGDNRYGAEDSRFIGLIAHSKMYGVVK